jgi:DNA modification methylase
MSAHVHIGNVLDVLPTLEAGSVNCVVTSPPYWSLRDYGVDGQLGLESAPDCGRRDKFRLRPDLTDAQREYVVRRLADGGRSDV